MTKEVNPLLYKTKNMASTDSLLSCSQLCHVYFIRNSMWSIMHLNICCSALCDRSCVKMSCVGLICMLPSLLFYVVAPQKLERHRSLKVYTGHIIHKWQKHDTVKTKNNLNDSSSNPFLWCRRGFYSGSWNQLLP